MLLKKSGMSVEEQLPVLLRLMKALEDEDGQGAEELLTELTRSLEFLYARYAEEIQYLAADEPQSETAELIGKGFVEVFALLRPLQEEVVGGEYSLALETADTLREAMESLYPLFRRFAKQYEDGPRYSEVPYTHELVRVCRHFLNGSLSREAVLARLDQFCLYHDNLEQQIESSRPSGAEQEAMAGNAEDLAEALKAQLQGIQDLEAALAEDEVSAELIEAGMELLTTAAEVLVDVYRSLRKADQEPRTFPCVKCSHPNVPTARTCGRCGAALPPGTALSNESTSTLALEEDGSSVHSPQPEELEKLRRAVSHFALTGELEPLRTARCSFARRYERLERQFQRMQKAESAVLAEFQSSFAHCLSSVREALELIESGEEAEDLAHLESGLARLGEANEGFENLRHSEISIQE